MIMNVEYINPFIEASNSVLKQAMNAEPKVGEISVKNSPYTSEGVASVVGLTGKIRGQVVLCMSVESAKHIASVMMMGTEVKELDEIAKSAISELSNMILGNTSTIYYNKGISVDITPPTLFMGENLKISSTKLTTICVPLIVDKNSTIEFYISIEE